MMTGPLLIAGAMWSSAIRPAVAFALRPVVNKRVQQNQLLRLFSASSSASPHAIEKNISRLSTLQTLLQTHGAPGSIGCREENVLEPVLIATSETPELITSLTGQHLELANLHPYLFPIAKSTSAAGHYICAYRNPFQVDDAQWPIVETKLPESSNAGIQLLAASSEHLMRRIVCECDFYKKNQHLIQLYNQGLESADSNSKEPYQVGSVEKLGYGVDKYVLLKVGPFPDLYQTMALEHSRKQDEQSSLIAAEAANAKCSGFGSNFLFYAQLLKNFPNRKEEARDAARMCLRLPLSTVGLDLQSAFQQVAVLGCIAEESDATEVAVQKLRDMYEKMREVERENDKEGKTPEQVIIEEANYIVDSAALDGKAWSSIRKQLGEKFRFAEKHDMARFVDPL